MIDEIDLAALLKRLRSRVGQDYAVMQDVLTLVADACIAPEGQKSDAIEIAKTILEIAYPERVGKVLLMHLVCTLCGDRLEAGSDKEQGTCLACRIKSGA